MKNNNLHKTFGSAKASVTESDAATAAQTNKTVTAAYTKGGSKNAPLVMIAHNLKGGIY